MGDMGRLIVDGKTVEMNGRVTRDLDLVLSEAHRFEQDVVVVGLDAEGQSVTIRISPDTQLYLQLPDEGAGAALDVPVADRDAYEDDLYDIRGREGTAVAYVDGDELLLESE